MSPSPVGRIMARTPDGVAHYGTTADTSGAPGMIGGVGSDAPHNNMQPYLVVNFIIAFEGEYPSMG